MADRLHVGELFEWLELLATVHLCHFLRQHLDDGILERYRRRRHSCACWLWLWPSELQASQFLVFNLAAHDDAASSSNRRAAIYIVQQARVH